MSRTLLAHAALVATFDDTAREIAGASLLLEDGIIGDIVEPGAPEPRADERIDCSNLVLIPGLVNTHHHFYQTLTRNLPAAQDAGLFDWLRVLYPIWARITPEALTVATKTAIAELLLSGCTTTSDHMYLWPNGCRLDDQIAAAQELGIRFHALRGSMSLGISSGGLPPDDLVEREPGILADCQRVIDAYHDSRRYAMTRIAIAPCSPFSVTPQLMKDSIALARDRGVHAHTHLAETLDEERYCIDTFGCRPVELAERLGWLGADVWHAHAVHVSDDDCKRLGATRTGAAHCATSNMRLGSGIAPVRKLLAAGVRVGLGVDGSASNDGSNMLDEARHAMLLQRVRHGARELSAREALGLATRGGAATLGRDDIGMLAPGMAADIAGWRIDASEFAGGAASDPLAALVFCRAPNAALVIVNGRVRVCEGALVDFDLPQHVRRHNDISRALLA
ncbi:MAG TPA: 8-oxoguanine deaminase [Candidatus Baltobacteraceae bacterium]